MTISIPRLPRPAPPFGVRIVILVIILAFIAVMAALGCPPAVALGVAAGTVMIAFNPGSARAVLGSLLPGQPGISADAAA